jgi:hypothetical protein
VFLFHDLDLGLGLPFLSFWFGKSCRLSYIVFMPMTCVGCTSSRLYFLSYLVDVGGISLVKLKPWTFMTWIEKEIITWLLLKGWVTTIDKGIQTQTKLHITLNLEICNTQFDNE